MAENAYILFEVDPIQILRITKLDIRNVQRTRKKDIVKISNAKMNIFVGTWNLEEESC